MIEHSKYHNIDSNNIQDVVKNIKNGVYKFYQFYNVEIDPDEHAYMDFMEAYESSSIKKVLNKTYYDIETYVNEDGDFTDPEEVDRPVNSIALYNNIKNICHIVCYVTDCDMTDPVEIERLSRIMFEETIKSNSTYDIPGIELVYHIEKDEKTLIQTFFRLIRELNTLALIGFNSNTFDDPFMINRTSKLFGEARMNDIVSEFGIVEKKGNSSYEIPDFLLVDILKLYKPVGSGGGGLGKSLPDFKLNTVAFKELKITKLDLPGGFRHNYLHNIVGYLTYNIFDTLLTFKLDDKLLFMESMYDLSVYNNATMGATINGRSILYRYRNDLMYNSQNKITRAKKFSSEVLFEVEIET